MKRLSLFAFFAACTLAPATAFAQAPTGIASQDAASSGATDVAQEGFQTVAAPGEGDDVTEATISAGGLLTSGNTRSLAVTGVGHFRLRRGDNQLGAAAAANFAATDVPRVNPDTGEFERDANGDPVEDFEPTVQNFQGNLRYDRFFSESLTGFLSVSGRNDTFQGLDLRLNFSPGLAYYFVVEHGLRFWGELGYDLQHDIRNTNFLAEQMLDLDRTETRHNVRAFLGYENVVNEAITVVTGLEYLQSVNETEFWRLNWDLALTSKLSDSFSIATTFTLKFDASPLPGVENTDTVTAVNLVYNLL